MRLLIWAAIASMVALAGCADTLETIRRDPSEQGQFQVARDYRTVVEALNEVMPKCWGQDIPISEIGTKVVRSLTDDMMTVELHQDGIFGERSLLAVDVKPMASGAEVTFYKSSGFHRLSSVRPKLERWAAGQDTRC